MNPAAYVGAKLFYLGFRMQPLRIRRAISLILSVGLKWTERNDDVLARVIKGEHLDIAIDFTTEATSEQPPADRGDGAQ